MNTTRRETLLFAGGSAVGLLFTPAPWRLITDTALWSENWPGIPAPARGEIIARYTNCSLCTAGCAVRARCVGDQPVLLSGADGPLCPFGLVGHHLPYLPLRVTEGPVIGRSGGAVQLTVASPRTFAGAVDLQRAATALTRSRSALK